MATTEALTENSRQGIKPQIPPCIGIQGELSRNLRPRCGHAYDETPAGLVVYVRNDPVNRIDPDGKRWRHIIDIGYSRYFEQDFIFGDFKYWEDDGDEDDSFINRGGGGGDPGPIDYCSNNATNNQSLSFFDAHKEDAEKIAKAANIPYEVVLAVAAEETLWGTKGIFNVTNNWFGLHVDDENDKSHYANQVSTYKATQDGWVATFAAKSGFYDSGMAFTTTKAGQLIAGMTLDQPLKIADTLHSNGYGTTNENYVSDLGSVLSRVIGSSKCPGR